MKKHKMAAVLLLAAALIITGCGEKPQVSDGEDGYRYEGVVLRDIIVPTSNLPSSGRITVYLPADWETSGKKYPVLYLLHGMWSNNNEWISNGAVAKTTTRMVSDGKCPELIVVTPLCNDCFYVDGYVKGHNYETFMHKDLIPFIESKFPVAKGRENTAIAGLSMGGFGASYHAFNYPDMFCLCYEMSGAVEGMGTPEVPSVKQIFEKRGYDKLTDFSALPKYYMECGTGDIMCGSANVNTHNYLNKIGFPHKYIERPGSHDWAFWTECYPKVLKAFAELLASH